MHYESPRQSGRSRAATTSSGRTHVAVANPSREDDTRPAGHIKKPSTIRGEAQGVRTSTRRNTLKSPRDVLSHSCNANTSAPTADPVANASAYRLGRMQNPVPARVMKYRP